MSYIPLLIEDIKTITQMLLRNTIFIFYTVCQQYVWKHKIHLRYIKLIDLCIQRCNWTGYFAVIYQFILNCPDYFRSRCVMLFLPTGCCGWRIVKSTQHPSTNFQSWKPTLHVSKVIPSVGIGSRNIFSYRNLNKTRPSFTHSDWV